MNWILIESNSINKVKYEFGILEIVFHNGGYYKYFDVSEDIYESFLSSNSKGSYFNKCIKNIYKYQKI